MATYRQFLAAMAKPGAKPKRITWLCGSPVLQHEAEKRITAGRVIWRASGADPPHVIWDLASWVPSDDNTHVLVIRSAQRIRNFAPLEAIAAARVPNFRLVFCADEDGYHLTDARGKVKTSSTGSKLLQPGPAVVQAASSGQIVRCILATEADQLAWVQGKVPGLAQTVAWRIVTHSGGDLSQMASLCEFVSLWPAQERSEALVRYLAPPTEAEAFTDLLLTGHKSAAFAAMPGEDALGAVVSRLGSALDWLDQLHSASLQQMTLRECVQAGVPQVIAAKFRQAAKAYPPSRTLACRQLLAKADDAFQRGVRQGLGEALAALW
jgi:hypothetical protein